MAWRRNRTRSGCWLACLLLAGAAVRGEEAETRPEWLLSPVVTNVASFVVQVTNSTSFAVLPTNVVWFVTCTTKDATFVTAGEENASPPAPAQARASDKNPAVIQVRAIVRPPVVPVPG